MVFKVLIASKAAFSQYQMVIASLVLRSGVATMRCVFVRNIAAV